MCYNYYLYGLITLTGDAKTNPGPKRHSTETFSFYHWNVNSIFSYNYVKIFLGKAYITTNLTSFVFLRRTCLDYDDLVIAGYDIARADHLTNTK